MDPPKFSFREKWQHADWVQLALDVEQRQGFVNVK